MWGSALKKRQGAGVPVPWGLPIQPLRGNLVVVMGAPGVGKSLFSLNLCLAANEPSVLVSLDTDMTTQAIRACSILSGATRQSVESRPTAWAQYLERRNLLCRMYDLSLRPEDINDLVLAETEYWGSAPSLVVVDNVANVVKDTSYESYRNCFLELQKVARLRGTVVVALHHVKRDSASGKLSLHSGQYSGEQEAELVLGLWRSSSTGLEVGILKNRNGMADPEGNYAHSLYLDSKTLRLEEPTRGLYLPQDLR